MKFFVLTYLLLTAFTGYWMYYRNPSDHQCLVPTIPFVDPVVKQDTVFGVALVLDTMYVSSLTWGESSAGRFVGKDTSILHLTTAVWPAYTVTTWEEMPGRMPKVISVGYWRLDDCEPIPFHRIFAFKQQ